jgi:acylphosphatase
VTGFVQNLPDGRVQIVAEGETSDVVAFLDEVESRMEQFIRDIRKDKTAPTGEFTTFDVRY